MLQNQGESYTHRLANITSTHNSTPTKHRFKSTLQAILRSPERGGLMVNNLIYRYDATRVDDGVGGDEGGQ